MLVSPGGLARYWPDIHSPRRFTDVDARSVAPGQLVSAWSFVCACVRVERVAASV